MIWTEHLSDTGEIKTFSLCCCKNPTGLHPANNRLTLWSLLASCHIC